MINNKMNPKAGETFYGLRVLAMCLALVMMAITMGAFNIAQGQSQVRTYSRNDVESFIREMELSSQEFQRDFDSWLDRSQVDGQRREDIYNRQVQALTSALSNLRSNFNRNNDWWLARNDMQRVLSAATNVNSIMASREVRGGLNRQWNRLRTNLNRLADAFNLPQVGTTFAGIQTYPTYGGNSRTCSITGTFRGWTNTGEAELSLSSNGSATARSLNTNAVYPGRCAGDVVYFDWGAFNLVRDGNRGISTVEIGNQRNRTSYRRVSGSGYRGDTSNYPTYPGNLNSNVPSWAVGVFRGMTNDGESEISIAPNGVATARSLNTNQVYNGQYANGVLTFDWGSFRLDQDGNGIRTIDVRNSRNRTSYQRVSGYPGNTGTGYPAYPTNPGTNSTVPDWAIGTFRGMTNNGETELTIDASGGVTVRALNTNQLYYGRFANDAMTLDWGTFRIVREGRGIATVEMGGQETRTSYRRVN